ncbi:MAG: glycosyltransferase [Vicinamibacterales bacterium]
MKLLHVVSSYLPAVRYGGTIVSVHGLCRALVDRGHDVHVYTTSVDGPRDSDVPHDQPVHLDGVKVWYFRSRQLRRLYWAPNLAKTLAVHVAEFDIVHTHAIYLWPLWAAARAARRAQVPYVVSPRGMLEQDLVDHKNPLLKGLWIAAIERHNLERASAIHVTSEREAGEAAAFGFKLPLVRQIPNGFTLDNSAGEPLSPAIDAIINGEPYVLFLGRINWKKGLDRLIGSLARVPAIRLVVAGNDEENYRAVLDPIAARLGVSSRIVFTGSVHGADKAALLAHARCLALPSHSENFGNVVIEAMAAGCPVIVSKDVGLANTVHAARAGLVLDGDADTLSGAISSLLGDAVLRQEMGERGRAVAHERYSWPVVAAQMEDLYASLLSRPAGDA